MASAYTPPEAERARLRADGKKLTLWGALLAGGGLAGIIVSVVLKVVFLGILGGAAAFGFIGLVLGPIILVTAGSLLRVFSRREPDTPAPGPDVTHPQ